MLNRKARSGDGAVGGVKRRSVRGPALRGPELCLGPPTAAPVPGWRARRRRLSAGGG